MHAVETVPEKSGVDGQRHISRMVTDGRRPMFAGLGMLALEKVLDFSKHVVLRDNGGTNCQTTADRAAPDQSNTSFQIKT